MFEFMPCVPQVDVPSMHCTPSYMAVSLRESLAMMFDCLCTGRWLAQWHSHRRPRFWQARAAPGGPSEGAVGARVCGCVLAVLPLLLMVRVCRRRA